jgi:hypothetical protein
LSGSNSGKEFWLNYRESNKTRDVGSNEQDSGLKEAMQLIDEGESEGSLKMPNGASVYVGQWDTLKQKMIWGTAGREEVETIQNTMTQHFKDVEAVPFKSQEPTNATRHTGKTGTKRGANRKLARTETCIKNPVWKRKNRTNEGDDTSVGGEQLQQGKRKGCSSEEMEGKSQGKKGKSVASFTNCTAEADVQPRPVQ